MVNARSEAYKCVKSTMRNLVKTTKPLTIFSTLQESKLVYQNDIDKIVRLVGGNRIIDVLLHVPVNYELWHKINSFKEINHGDNCCVEVTVKEVVISKMSSYTAIKKHAPSVIKTTTSDGYKLDLKFFNFSPKFIANYKIGQRIVCQGKLNIDKHDKCSIVHPHITARIQAINGCMLIYKLNQLEDYGLNVDKIQVDNIVPIYSLTDGVRQNYIISLIEKIFNNDRFDFSSLDSCDYLLSKCLNGDILPSAKESLIRLHFPKSVSDICDNSIFLKKLAFLELLSFHYILSKARVNREMESGISINGNGKMREKMIQNLPFSLTEDQLKCLKEIYKDQASDKKMLRLLQGDVGSGKTIVALMSALNAIESGHKVVIMAPTAILAKQHFATALKFCFGLGLSIELLIGETKQKARKDVLTRMNLGQIDILIGTHTLFQSKLELPKNIGLFIIDEQHNFGVEQRVSLVNKVGNADVLMLSATPIPRTMIMSLYGDISVSCIINKPSDRLHVETRILCFDDKYNSLVEGINRKIVANEKVYWVCPLVEESEKLDYIDVETRARELAAVIDKTKIGVLHGKMSQEKKDKIMLDFKNGVIQLLVSTTVIEVGVDVPDATIIVIENAEKFGLAQLHQLRGRVGRGTKQSYCFLLYSGKVSDIGKKRLSVLRDLNNGFDIAEFDLKVRGGGTLLDKKQSGFRTMKFVNFSRDRALVNFLNHLDINNIDKIVIQPILCMFCNKNEEKLIKC